MSRQRKLDVQQGYSTVSKIGGLIVTALEIRRNKARIVIGRPGMPNTEVTLNLGDATIYETPEGLFEFRLLRVVNTLAEILLTDIAPRPGLAAGYVEQDVENLPFTDSERQRLSESLEQIRLQISTRSDISKEQLAFIAQKLLDMDAAAQRFGRKDWINWALGTLTSLVVTAALDPTAARALFQLAGTALNWVLGSSIKLLE